MERVEREIKVISEKGWGWWDYKAVGCPGKQRKFHIADCLPMHILDPEWLLPIPVPVSYQSLDLAQFEICKVLLFYFSRFLGSHQIHKPHVFWVYAYLGRDIHLYNAT